MLALPRSCDRMHNEEMTQSYVNLRFLQSSHADDVHEHVFRQYRRVSGQIFLILRVLECYQVLRCFIKLSTLPVLHSRRAGSYWVVLGASLELEVSQEMQYFLDLFYHLHISCPFLNVPGLYYNIGIF